MKDDATLRGLIAERWPEPIRGTLDHHLARFFGLIGEQDPQFVFVGRDIGGGRQVANLDVVVVTRAAVLELTYFRAQDAVTVYAQALSLISQVTYNVTSGGQIEVSCGTGGNATLSWSSATAPYPSELRDLAEHLAAHITSPS